ncbi:MAG: hypothetical protein HXY44_18805 [Syntrophaceae bacterium]|nr:hypothetical protein [Syntrophaceae bacterium]
MATKKSTLRFEDYIKGIERLRPDEQLNLIQIISARLKTNLRRGKVKHSLMELEGLGAPIWKGIDAQQYVNKERKSWD